MDDNELRMAAEKFEESKQLAEMAMFNVLDNEAEQIAQLSAFVQAELDFHKQSAALLDRLEATLKEKMQAAACRPKREYKPKKVNLPVQSASATGNLGALTMASSAASSTHSLNMAAATNATASLSLSGQSNGAFNSASRPSNIDVRQATARVLYDFEAENTGELGLKEGQIVKLLQQVDENWFEGEVDAHRGFFPITYVEVIVPLK